MGAEKGVVLFLLVLQSCASVLIMRYVRSRSSLFFSTTAVVSSEVLKLLICLNVIYYEAGTIERFLKLVYTEMRDMKGNFEILVPALVYALQNNLIYVASTNLDAPTFQVTAQLKILTTAVCSVFILNKAISRMQWMALFLLFVGVSLVQLEQVSPGAKSSTTFSSYLTGLTAVLLACTTSGFAGVWTEKVLKDKTRDVWVSNARMAFFGLISAFIMAMIKDGVGIRRKGFFFCYDSWVWAVVALQGLGGLLVAAVMKYADNILKGYAFSLAILLSCVLSIFIFDFAPSLLFISGAGLVTSSVFVYNRFPPVRPDVTVPSSGVKFRKSTLQS